MGKSHRLGHGTWQWERGVWPHPCLLLVTFIFLEAGFLLSSCYSRWDAFLFPEQSVGPLAFFFLSLLCLRLLCFTLDLFHQLLNLRGPVCVSECRGPKPTGFPTCLCSSSFFKTRLPEWVLCVDLFPFSPNPLWFCPSVSQSCSCSPCPSPPIPR